MVEQGMSGAERAPLVPLILAFLQLVCERLIEHTAGGGRSATIQPDIEILTDGRMGGGRRRGPRGTAGSWSLGERPSHRSGAAAAPSCWGPSLGQDPWVNISSPSASLCAEICTCC